MNFTNHVHITPVIEYPTVKSRMTRFELATARNLGIVFDSALNFKSHISGISRACYYHIRDMRRIRRFLTPSVAKTNFFDR